MKPLSSTWVSHCTRGQPSGVENLAGDTADSAALTGKCGPGAEDSDTLWIFDTDHRLCETCTAVHGDPGGFCRRRISWLRATNHIEQSYSVQAIVGYLASSDPTEAAAAADQILYFSRHHTSRQNLDSIGDALATAYAGTLRHHSEGDDEWTWSRWALVKGANVLAHLTEHGKHGSSGWTGSRQTAPIWYESLAAAMVQHAGMPEGGEVSRANQGECDLLEYIGYHEECGQESQRGGLSLVERQKLEAAIRASAEGRELVTGKADAPLTRDEAVRLERLVGEASRVRTADARPLDWWPGAAKRLVRRSEAEKGPARFALCQSFAQMGFSVSCGKPLRPGPTPDELSRVRELAENAE
jgi:hypothetical protein